MVAAAAPKTADPKTAIPKNSSPRNGMAKNKEKTEKPAKAAGKGAAKAGKKSAADAMLESTPELRNTVAAIEKQYGEGSIMALGGDHVRKIDGIPTGSLSLDIALGGQGIPKGRVIEIFGPESSGKTTLALHVAAQSQKA